MTPNLLDACRLTLLFHSETPWTDDKVRRWFELSGRNETTSRGLYNYVQTAVKNYEADNL